MHIKLDFVPKGATASIAHIWRPHAGSVEDEMDLLVFVHGWNGEPVATWRWIHHWLGDAGAYSRPHDAIWYGYESRSLQANACAENFRMFLTDLLEDPSRYISELLNPPREGAQSGIPHKQVQRTQYKRIVLFGHSLGGAVVRRAALDLASLVQPPQWLDDVRLILLAPADAGVNPRMEAAARLLDSLTSNVRLGSILNELAMIGSPSFADLKQDASFLKDLRNDALALKSSKSGRIRTFRSSGTIRARRDRVVRNQQLISDDVLIDDRADVSHMSVCKFDSPNCKRLMQLMEAAKDAYKR